MSAALDSQQQVTLSRECDCTLDIRNTAGLHNQRRKFVDRLVQDTTRGVVTLVAGQQQQTTQAVAASSSTRRTS